MSFSYVDICTACVMITQGAYYNTAVANVDKESKLISHLAANNTIERRATGIWEFVLQQTLQHHFLVQI